MTTLYQLELDQRNVDCGMSYVFQLDSGAFFLIDGGFFTEGEADRLYRFLRERSDGKPVIADWFFSHAHQDHIGVFLDMVLNHGDDVEIRGLTYNFQPLPLPETGEGWRIKSNDLATVRKFYEVTAERCADIPVRTPHTGDRWTLEALDIEVLYTHEDLRTESSFNDHSTVIRVTCEGQSILFLGDIWTEGSRIMLETVPEKLRCDLVQVAHHGFDGASEELYRAAGAKVALWPTAVYNLKPNENLPANRYLRTQSGIVEHLVSGRGTVALPLPYEPGHSTVISRLEENLQGSES